MLQEHFRIRQAMKTHTLNITHPSLRKNTRILNILGCITTDNTQSLQQQLITLKQHTSADNVHFTATMVKESKTKTTPSVPYWRGFVIHQSIGAIRMWQPDSGGAGVAVR
jgi:predicted metal-binding protein